MRNPQRHEGAAGKPYQRRLPVGGSAEPDGGVAVAEGEGAADRTTSVIDAEEAVEEVGQGQAAR